MKEKFYVGPGSENLEGFKGEMEALQTDEQTYLSRRERKFQSERGYKDLVHLKVMLQDLRCRDLNREETGILMASFHPEYITDVIAHPEVHAVSSLGFSTLDQTIDPKLLQQRVNEFLEKTKIEYVKRIDRDIQFISEYKGRTQSIALDNTKGWLEVLKGLVLEGNWQEFAERITRLKAYLDGMNSVLELTTGGQLEPNSVRKEINAPLQDEGKR